MKFQQWLDENKGSAKAVESLCRLKTPIPKSPMTFEQLPLAVESLSTKIDAILAILESERNTELKDIITIAEAAEILCLAKGTITQKVYRNEIPHFKQGRKLRFSRADLDKWVRDARVSTTNESFNLKYTRK